MKKIMVIISFLLGISVFGADFSTIDTFSLDVKERSVINKKEKKKEYILKVKFPDKIYKEMKKPDINKGEQYIYNGNKKTIYIPALKQKNTKDIEEEENYIIKVMRDIKNINYSRAKNGIIEIEDGKVKVDTVSKKVLEAEYEDETKVVFEKYSEIAGYNFPVKVTIYDKGAFLSQLDFSNIKINEKIGNDIFILN